MKVGKWKLMLPLALLVMGGTVAVSGALATPAQSDEVKFAIMTDCKGAFAFGYEVDAAGSRAALSQYAGAEPDRKKPSAGMTGGTAGGKDLNLVGIGCGDESPALALKETRRLMNQLGADVMIGPLSGDEAVAIANWAKANPAKTVIIGTAGSQDPTMQIAPKRTCSATTATALSGTPASGRSSTRSSVGVPPRLSETTTASRDLGCRHRCRLLRNGGQDHQARLDAADRRRLRRSSASCRDRIRSTVTSGSSEAPTRALPSRRSSRHMALSTRSSTRATCSSSSWGTSQRLRRSSSGRTSVASERPRRS